jgi:hypothetical protein
MITTALVKSVKASKALQKERDDLLKQLRDREDSLLCKVCLITSTDVSQALILPCLHREVCQQVFSYTSKIKIQEMIKADRFEGTEMQARLAD